MDKIDKRHENKGRPTKDPKEKIEQFWAYAPKKFIDSAGGEKEASALASELFCREIRKQNRKLKI